MNFQITTSIYLKMEKELKAQHKKKRTFKRNERDL